MCFADAGLSMMASTPGQPSKGEGAVDSIAVTH
jgi:hypothetical protein